MKKRGLIIIILILLLNLILVSSNDVGDKVESSVYKNLEKQEEITIVIEIKEPPNETGILIKTEKSDERIEKEKEEIKDSIKEDIGEESIRHEFDSHISMQVNAEELEELKRNENIVSILSVEKVHAFLQDSVPLINASNTWKLQYNTLNLTGLGETVCIVDTGTNFSHPDLVGKNKTACLIDCIGKACIENCSKTDDHGHGTHVAGIVGASGGISGVAINISMIGVKVLNSVGSGSFDDVAAAINWCINNANNYNISVITMSLGTDCDNNPELCYTSYCDSQPVSSLVTPAINNATNYNISVIIASGNEGQTAKVSAPACVTNATTVGATTKADAMWSSTNRNSLVDLLAPGGSINSTRWNPSSCRAGWTCAGNYAIVSGTSMATPHVAGAFAIINQLYKLQSNRDATPSEIQNLLNITGKNIDDSSGSGLNFSRIDIYSAVLFADATSPSVNLTSPINNRINSNLSQNFNCSASDWQLKNITFYLWNSSGILIYSETKNISGTDNSSSFNYTLSYQAYKWNCLASDNRGNFAYASSNNTLIMNLLSVNLTNPSNPAYIKKGSNMINNTNFSVNVSSSEDSHLKNATFYIWNSSGILVYNQTKNISGVNNSTFIYYNITLEGNYSWNYLVFNNVTNSSFANNNYTILYDKTDPVLQTVNSSVSSSSAIISMSANENCNYSVNYGLSEGLGSSAVNAVNSTTSSITIFSLTSSADYYYNVTYCDIVGNCFTNGTYNFTTSEAEVVVVNNDNGGGGGGGGGGSVTEIPLTYVVNLEQLNSGIEKSLKKNEKIKFNFNLSEHFLTLNSFDNYSANISLMSNPMNFILVIGQELKINLTSGDYYDLYLKLISINNNSANISIRKIMENVIKIDNSSKLIKKETPAKKPVEEDSSYEVNKALIIYITGIVFIAVIIIIILFMLFKKPEKDKLKEYREIFNKKLKPRN
ncbi:S8 family serine peptidase [Candidatus Pacearchaeota archaeon]|nr:S8 family serine peptidase [Candidatus Pacearchaeota archaeon]